MRCIRKTGAFIASVLFIFVLACPAESEPSDTLFDWRPITVGKDLASDLRRGETRSDRTADFLRFQHIIGGNHSPKEFVASDKQNNKRWTEFHLWYFKVFLSTMTASRIKWDWSQQYHAKGNKLEMIKSLPTLFQTATSRETLESLGTIIEPQIRLGITF